MRPDWNGIAAKAGFHLAIRLDDLPDGSRPARVRRNQTCGWSPSPRLSEPTASADPGPSEWRNRSPHKSLTWKKVLRLRQASPGSRIGVRRRIKSGASLVREDGCGGIRGISQAPSEGQTLPLAGGGGLLIASSHELNHPVCQRRPGARPARLWVAGQGRTGNGRPGQARFPRRRHGSCGTGEAFQGGCRRTTIAAWLGRMGPG